MLDGLLVRPDVAMAQIIRESSEFPKKSSEKKSEIAKKVVDDYTID